MEERNLNVFLHQEEYEEIKNCIACDSNILHPVLDLNPQPLANSYRDFKNEEQNYFPLATNVCEKCFHMQLTHKVNPDLLFKNYLYVSGTTNTQKEYFNWFANFTSEYVNNFQTNQVLDIGCNDGSQLDAYKALGWKTKGIDPAKNLHVLSSKNHDVICDYFSEKYTNIGIFDIILCQNAFAHNFDQFSFLKNVKQMMSKDSLLFITTSQVDMILNGEFDTIYHEHLSFYTIKSMNALCERAGLNLIDVVRHSIHGNSYIFVISKSRSREFHLENLIAYEKSLGLHDLKTYYNYAKSCIEKANNLNNFIEKIKSYEPECRVKIVGFGAPAKGNTLMNFMKNGPDFIIDENELKCEKFIPGLDIQIHNMNYLKQFDNDKSIIFIPLAWNFYDEIVKKIKTVRSNHNDVFVKYFPNIVLNGWDDFLKTSPVLHHPI